MVESEAGSEGSRVLDKSGHCPAVGAAALPSAPGGAGTSRGEVKPRWTCSCVYPLKRFSGTQLTSGMSSCRAVSVKRAFANEPIWAGRATSAYFTPNSPGELRAAELALPVELDGGPALRTFVRFCAQTLQAACSAETPVSGRPSSFDNETPFSLAALVRNEASCPSSGPPLEAQAPILGELTVMVHFVSLTDNQEGLTPTGDELRESPDLYPACA